MKNNNRPAALLLLGTLWIAMPAFAGDKVWPYGDWDLRGEWIWSGDLKFAAPVPVPGTHLHEAPPHGTFQPGDKIGIWGTILGTMSFDGRGNVTQMEDLFKPGEIELGPPFPPIGVPPSPEVGVGTYAVNSNGVVVINIRGRDPNNPEGQVDFETDYHCQLNRYPREMTCLISRFKTFFVDPSGYEAPISGVITFSKRY